MRSKIQTSSPKRKRASLDIHYVSGEETEGVVQGLFNIEPAFIARMKQVLVP